jgi:hypothetical protein
LLLGLVALVPVRVPRQPAAAHTVSIDPVR